MDDTNNNANITCCGAKQYNSNNIEGLALANSLAVHAKCKPPFPDVRLPSIDTNEKEFFGCSNVCNVKFVPGPIRVITLP